MRIKNLKLRNFLSYEKLDFSFHTDQSDPPAIFIISGINKDASNNTDNSNGSGKSTLVGESLSFNLFGKNLRGSSKKIKLENAIKFGEGSLINETEYFVNSDSILKIRREKERDGKSKLSIKMDGEENSKRLNRLTENDIREFVGIDPEVYYQTISYYKDNISLLAMNYSQRLEFFKNLIDLSVMDEYYLKCKKKKTELEKSLFALDTKKKAQYDILEALNSGETKYIGIIEEAIIELKQKIEELEATEEVDLSKFEDKLEKTRELKDQLDSLIKDCKIEVRDNSSKARSIEQEIKNFSKLKNINCPTCNQMVTGDYADEIIANKREHLDLLNTAIKAKEDEIESLSEKILKIVDKEKKITKELEKAKSENTIRKVNLQNYNKQLIEKNKELEQIKAAASKDEEKNIYIEKIKELEEVEKKLIRKQTINSFWLENFANKSSVRSVIMRKHIGTLSDIFEYYLGKLFRNTIIGRMEIDDEGNIDILLSAGDHEVNYWNLSSGERKRADIAVLFALYTYTINIAPNAPKFLILDEVFDSLDGVGKEYVTEAILDIYKNFGIDIFIISHVDFPTVLFETVPVKRILVTKEDGASSAEFI